MKVTATPSKDGKIITLTWDKIPDAVAYELDVDGNPVLVDGKRHFWFDPSRTNARFGVLDGSHTYGVRELVVADHGAVVWPLLDPPTDAWTPAPPVPPQTYAIPAGAKVLEDGTYGDLTISAPTYARHLGGAVIKGAVTFRGDGALLQGAVVDGVADFSGSGDGCGLLDCEVHAGGAGIAVYVYRCSGFFAERCRVDGFTDQGFRITRNTDDGTIIKRLWDLWLSGGDKGGATGGTGEVPLWVGHQVADGVRRIYAEGGYTAQVERVNACRNTLFEDILCVNNVGLGTAWYDEHTTSGCTSSRVHLKSEAGAGRVEQDEYKANFTQGASQHNIWDHCTFEGGRVGYNAEDSAYLTVTNTRFVGQTEAGIRLLRVTGFTQSGNDFSRLAPGAKTVEVAG